MFELLQLTLMKFLLSSDLNTTRIGLWNFASTAFVIQTFMLYNILLLFLFIKKKNEQIYTCISESW